ncbi:MAG: site-specific DNA-methyltransferase [Phycisphaeraceae bacterium]|nr:site-specific DNA-methyltransferase [Phycisphaeraceae bacterium]
MAKNINRLELTWIGKENRPQLEPRILIEDPDKSYHADHRVNEKDAFDNRLIFGDNLLALKALEQEFAGKIKCIFIDPPYNTGSAFKQYDDGVEHSLWLSLMRDRLELLRRLLSEDGSLWITIDDNECHYLKVLCDEVFGRNNFVSNVIWEKKSSPQNDAKWLSDNHDHVLVYAKNKILWRPKLLPRSEKQNKNMKNPDNYPRGVWISSDYTCAKSKEERPNLYYPILNPNTGEEIWPNHNRVWAFNKDSTKINIESNNLYWGAKGLNKSPRLKKFPDSVRQGTVATTVWRNDDVGNNQEAKKEVNILNSIDIFSTPKPERLIRRVLTLATENNDIILDSFAGSGTTGAVAHKMGRRWIMIELGEHCHTHIIPRLQKVIDGEDLGGITKTVDWKGGGGFRYYHLGPTLIVNDEWDNPIINPTFNAAMLAEAMCKLEGFSFDPDAQVYWQQGKSTEADFIYVTTQFMSKDMLTKLSDGVGPNRSLLICCSAFRCDASQFENLTIKKIPKAVLTKCEWGHDDYSLEIENLPAPPAPEVSKDTDSGGHKKPARPRKFGKNKDQNTGPMLFDLDTTDAKGGK